MMAIQFRILHLGRFQGCMFAVLFMPLNPKGEACADHFVEWTLWREVVIAKINNSVWEPWHVWGLFCVDYDLFRLGESILQVGGAAHRSSAARTIQAMNGLLILDYMLAARKDIDRKRIGVNSGLSGGTQTVLLDCTG